MTRAVRLTAAVLGTPGPRGPARFHLDLLGRPIRDDTDDWATLRPAGGCTGPSFRREADHVPPVRPPEPGTQQMQQHLDVEGLDEACTHAESLGARPLGGHTEPEEVVRVHADPAGHPFRLFVSLGA